MSTEPTFSPVVIVPTYNNGTTLPGILDRIRTLGLPIIVVNDGSTDHTAEILSRWSDADVAQPPLAVPSDVLTHERNRGKAEALRTGFRFALDAGHTHAVTIDSDGQLDPEQIPDLLAAARSDPHALILGVRAADTDHYPRSSRLGRSLSNLAIKIECGVSVHDSQCGLRVYPLEGVEAAGCRAGRFAFEAEVITRGAWSGGRVVEVPVRCHYQPAGEHISHFRPWWDTLCGIGLHARLLVRTLAPWPHRRSWPREEGEPAAAKPPMWRRLLRWLNPVRAWRQMVDPEVDRGEVAAAMALGVFIANLPIYPLQTFACLYAAGRLHLHPAVILAGCMISTPPLSFALMGGAVAVGHAAMNGDWPTLADYDPDHLEPAAIAGRTLVELGVGSLLMGVGMAISAFMVTYALVGYVRQRRARQAVQPAASTGAAGPGAEDGSTYPAAPMSRSSRSN